MNTRQRPTAAPLHREEEEQQTPEMEIVSASAIEAEARASIDMQIATAKRYLRGDVQKIRDNIMAMATMDDETAGACFYTLKRKEANGEEKIIQEASIRLAEIAVYCWKNIRIGTQIIANDGMQLTAQGACHDLENNIFVSQTADRPIASRDKSSPSGYRTWSLDMQVVTANAASSIAYRNAAFKVIPKFVIKPVLDACKKKAAGEGPIEGRWQKTVLAFRPWGISDAMLKTYLGKPLDKPVAEAITDEDIGNLKGLFASLRDQESTVQDTFGHINKDGSLKQQQSQTEHHEERAVEQTEEKTEEAVEEKKDRHGVVTPDQFSLTELGKLEATAKANGHPIANRAQLVGFMQSFGNKAEFADYLSKPFQGKK